jgi:hypothetical protein
MTADVIILSFGFGPRIKPFGGLQLPKGRIEKLAVPERMVLSLPW